MSIQDVLGLGLLSITAIGIVFAYLQLRASRNIAFGEFLLHLDERLDQYRSVHVRLRNGGEWDQNRGGPTTAEERADVIAYMGVFERINILVEKRMIDMHTVKRLYRHRLRTIVRNNAIKNITISLRAGLKKKELLKGRIGSDQTTN